MHLDWIDRYKGLLIILVVMGHVIGGAVHLTTGLTQQVLHHAYLVIYSFHMPAFFFIAGLTWKDKGESLISFARHKAKRLLVPYVVFGLLSTLLWAFMSGSAVSATADSATTDYYATRLGSSVWTCLLGLLHAGGLSDGNGFRMNSVLWFLPCLFSVLLVYWGVRCARLVGLKILPVVVICCILGVFSPRYFPHLPWGLSQVPYYLLFVMLGHALRDVMMEPRIMNCLNGGRKVLVVFAAAIAFCFVVTRLPDPWVANISTFWWVVYLLVAAVGTVLFAFIAHIVRLRVLSACGVASLGIMLIHKFPVVFLELKVACVRQLFNTGAGGALGATVGLTALVVILCYCCFLLLRRVAPWAVGVRK